MRSTAPPDAASLARLHPAPVPFPLSEIAWFVAGAAASGGLLAIWSRRWRTTAASTPDPQPATPAPLPAPPAAPPSATPAEDEPHLIALALAEELASLISGVEGRAHALIECAPQRELLPPAAEALLASITRLRTLHRKLLAYGRGGDPATGATDIGDLVAGLGDDLTSLQLGLELRWDPPPALPRLAANASAIREALLYLCSGLLRAERGASRLTIAAELDLTDTAPLVRLEFTLEWVAERFPARAAAQRPQPFSIELDAARNLLRSQGGEVDLHHLPGHSARAVVRLPAMVHDPVALDASSEPVPPPAPGPDRRHRYGGALLLEADPTVRAMLAAELKAAGRAVFVCADGAAARTFLDATPERFELLIADDGRRLADDPALAATIRDRAPGLKVCLLGRDADAQPPPWPAAHHIDKPFGLHELRQALASVLAAG